MVRLKGLEPTRIAAREPKSRMSTNSITGACSLVCHEEHHTQKQGKSQRKQGEDRPPVLTGGRGS